MQKKTAQQPRVSPYDLDSIAKVRTQADSHRPALKEPRRPYELGSQKASPLTKSNRNG